MVTILGAGCWGTTLAELAANNQSDVRLWSRSKLIKDEINQKRTNHAYTLNYSISPHITAFDDLKKSLDQTNMVVLAVPAKAISDLIKTIQPWIATNTMIICASKGLEPTQKILLSEVIQNKFPKNPIGVLSGPNLALEILAKYPAATVIASLEKELINTAVDIFSGPFFRIYGNHDVKGVEIGGIAKNVMTIAAGISEGLGFGANTKASLLTRGLVEMQRIGSFFGAKPETMFGLSGIGDLMATGFSHASRNFRFGKLIAEGKTVEEALKSINQSVEGISTTRIFQHLADNHQLKLPITSAIYRIIEEGSTPEKELKALMGRTSKYEFESSPFGLSEQC